MQGWMAEKTETTLTVTRGTWTYFDDNWDDVIDDRFEVVTNETVKKRAAGKRNIS